MESRTIGRDAGKIARLNVLSIINEPTAAAMAYGLDKMVGPEKTVLIYDLGGGTFDVSILKIKDGVFDVKATAGNTNLGGNDFDNRLVDHFINVFKRKYRMDISESKRAVRKLKTECELAKLTLSSYTQATISIESLYDGIDFFTNISRAKFEDLCMELFQETIALVGKTLADAGMQKTQITGVVLVGGSTRIPVVQRLLRNFFNGKKLDMTINPDEAVANGAAIHAAILRGEQLGKRKNIILKDVTPLSLGIKSDDSASGKRDVMSVIVKRNTPIPTKNTKYYTTTCDYQKSIEINVYEGERPVATDNHFLGNFDLSGITAALAGIPSIRVTFSIDEDGILDVSAVENSSGRRNRISIANYKGRLNSQEINRLTKEADHAECDKDRYQQWLARRRSRDSYRYRD